MVVFQIDGVDNLHFKQLPETEMQTFVVYYPWDKLLRILVVNLIIGWLRKTFFFQKMFIFVKNTIENL